MQKLFSRKYIIVLISVVLPLCAGLLILSIGISGTTERERDEQLDLGARYLSELDYEQALAAFEAVLAIDPKCVNAYIGAADAYAGMGDYENAIRILDTGYVEVQSKLISDKRDEVEQLYLSQQLEVQKQDIASSMEVVNQVDSGISQWEADLSPSEEKLFEEIMKALSNGSEEDIEDKLINSSFVSIMERDGYKCATSYDSLIDENIHYDVIYGLDYGNTVDGEGISFQMTKCDYGLLRILAYYGSWENGVADGYGKLIEIHKIEESYPWNTWGLGYVALLFGKAEGTWVDGFAEGEFQYTEHRGSDDGSHVYETITGSLKQGAWDGEVIRNSIYESYAETIHSIYIDGIAQKLESIQIMDGNIMDGNIVI